MASCCTGPASSPHGRGQWGVTYPALARRRAKSAGQRPSGAVSSSQDRTSARNGSASGGRRSERAAEAVTERG